MTVLSHWPDRFTNFVETIIFIVKVNEILREETYRGAPFRGGITAGAQTIERMMTSFAPEHPAVGLDTDDNM